MVSLIRKLDRKNSLSDLGISRPPAGHSLSSLSYSSGSTCFVVKSCAESYTYKKLWELRQGSALRA